MLATAVEEAEVDQERWGDEISDDWTDVTTLHDNGKWQDELERNDSSIRDLRPSEIKMELDMDIFRSPDIVHQT